MVQQCYLCSNSSQWEEQGLFCSTPQTKMVFFNVGIHLPGQHMYIPDVHETRPLSFVADTIRVRKGVGVSSVIHLGYERPVPGQFGPEMATEIVPLCHSTTVAQAYNLILQASYFALSAVYVQMDTHFIKHSAVRSQFNNTLGFPLK